MSQKKIECPRCWVEMKEREEEIFGPNVNIDICPKCNGIWLDHGELKKMIKDREVADYLTKDIGLKSRSPLICPRCRNLMDLEKAEDVEVDVCLQCKGVWLDADELEGLKNVPKDGFKKDEIAKTEEKWEQYNYKARNSKITKFFNMMSRKNK
jgi:Zn-finger nucleic acid-binding protein